MKIQISIVAFTLAAAVAAASAQSYKWIDKDGKVQYGDNPPPGAKVTALKPPPASGASPAAATPGAAKDAKKGPLTPAEQDQALKKRQIEAKEGADKAEKERLAAEEKKRNCDRAQAYLRSLESGTRISRTDDKGERYFIDDPQRATEMETTRKDAAQWCGA